MNIFLCWGPKGRIIFSHQIRCLRFPQKAENTIRINRSLFARPDIQRLQDGFGDTDRNSFEITFYRKVICTPYVDTLTTKQGRHNSSLCGPSISSTCQASILLLLLLGPDICSKGEGVKFPKKSFLMDTSTLIHFQATHQEIHIIEVHFFDVSKLNKILPSGNQKSICHLHPQIFQCSDSHNHWIPISTKSLPGYTYVCLPSGLSLLYLSLTISMIQDKSCGIY